MKAAQSLLPRVVSAVLAVGCSLAIVAALAGRFDPVRLASEPHVVELQRVVVTATAPAPTPMAAARATTATTATN